MEKAVYKLDEETFEVLKPYIIYTDFYKEDPVTKTFEMKQEEITDLIINYPEILQKLPDADFSKDMYVLTECLIKNPKTRLYSLAYQKDLDLQFIIQLFEGAIVMAGDKVLTNLFYVASTDLNKRREVIAQQINTFILEKKWSKAFFSDRLKHKYIIAPQKDGTIKKIRVGFIGKSEEMANKKFNKELLKQGVENTKIKYSREFEIDPTSELIMNLTDHMFKTRLTPILSDYYGAEFSLDLVKKVADVTNNQEAQNEKSVVDEKEK